MANFEITLDGETFLFTGDSAPTESQARVLLQTGRLTRKADAPVLKGPTPKDASIPATQQKALTFLGQLRGAGTSMLDIPTGIANAALDFVNPQPPGPGRQPAPFQIESQDVGVGAAIGETVGGIAGTALMPGVGTVTGATLGAGAGQAAEDFIRTGTINTSKAITEAAISLVPEVVETVARGGLRFILRMTRGAEEIQLDEAARIARNVAPGTFAPPGKAQIDALFSLFRTQGTLAQTSDAQRILGSLTPDSRRRIMRELRGLGSDVADALQAGAPMSIVELDDFRSLLGQQAANLSRASTPGAPRVRAVLLQIQSAIDDGIDTVLASTNLPGTAQNARQAYHRFKASERLHDLLTKSPITKSIKGGDSYQFFLDRLDNILNDEKSMLAKRINKDLAQIPGAQAQFQVFRQTLKDTVPASLIGFSDVSGLRRYGGVGFIDRMLSHVITSPKGQMLFRQAVLHGRGKMSVNTLAIIFNIVRRGTERGASPLGSGSNVQGQATPLSRLLPQAQVR